MKIDVLIMNNKPHKYDNLEQKIHASVLEVDDHNEEGNRDYWKITEECKYKGRLLFKENCLELPKDYNPKGVAEYRIYHSSVNMMKNVILNLIRINEPFDIEKASIITQMLQGGSSSLEQALKDYNTAKTNKEKEDEKSVC